MPLKTVAEPFVRELSDTYSADKQMTRPLPKLSKAATAPELEAATSGRRHCRCARPPHSRTMTVSTHTLLASVLAMAAATATMHAPAQPTGNPKGTTAPTEQRSSQPGTPRSDAPARPGGAATNPDAPDARSGALRQPGTGTTGGLSGRHPGDGSKTGTTSTDQAPPAGTGSGARARETVPR